jgi:hypothetical protein
MPCGAPGCCATQVRRRLLPPLARRRRQVHHFIPHTTAAQHAYCRYPNLLLGRMLHRLNEAWVADLTYVRRLPRSLSCVHPGRVFAALHRLGTRAVARHARDASALPCGQITMDGRRSAQAPSRCPAAAECLASDKKYDHNTTLFGGIHDLWCRTLQ